MPIKYFFKCFTIINLLECCPVHWSYIAVYRDMKNRLKFNKKKFNRIKFKKL